MMNDEKFELTISDLAGSGTYYADIADELRARDTAQREALARVEEQRNQFAIEYTGLTARHMITQAQLAEALLLIRDAKEGLRTGPDYGWEDRLANQLGEFLARHAQAEQQEAQGAQAGDERAAFEKWAKDRSWFDPRPSTKERDDSLFCYEEAITDHNWIAWQARAALATQPAAVSDLLAVIHRDGGHYQDQHGLDKAAREAEAIVQAERANQPAAGEPVAWIIESPEGCSPCKSINHLKHMAERYAAVGWSVTPLYAAPPAAAHGDEAVRKDAERYRWLKENCQENADDFSVSGQLCFGTYQAGRLDEAIDDAMHEGGEA